MNRNLVDRCHFVVAVLWNLCSHQTGHTMFQEKSIHSPNLNLPICPKCLEHLDLQHANIVSAGWKWSAALWMHGGSIAYSVKKKNHKRLRDPVSRYKA